MRHVIDANCWCLYIDERLSETKDCGHGLFEPANPDARLLFDDGLQMKQQYIDLKKPYSEQLFDSWFEAYTLRGQISVVIVKGKANFRKELLKLGLPKGEHIYFRVAAHGCAEFLISGDIDFYDPEKKYVGEKQRLAVLKAGKGPVCRHMRKHHNVTICCPEVFLQ